MVRPRTIDRARILAAAVGVADQRGPDAVTMAAVADRLGVTSMALYRHVADKADLLDGIVEHLLAEIADAGAAAPARRTGLEALVALARGARTVAARHPGAFPLVLTRPAVTDAAGQVRGRVHTLLREAGVGPDDVGRLERIVTTAVLGMAAGQASQRFAHHAPEVRDDDFRALVTFVEAGLAPFRSPTSA